MFWFDVRCILYIIFYLILYSSLPILLIFFCSISFLYYTLLIYLLFLSIPIFCSIFSSFLCSFPLFFSSDPFLPFFPIYHPPHSKYTCRWLVILIYILSLPLPSPPSSSLLIYPSSFLLSSTLSSPLLPSPPLPSSLPPPHPHSFYTCRYLHTLTYTLLIYSDNSTPHVLSEWMVEV